MYAFVIYLVSLSFGDNSPNQSSAGVLNVPNFRNTNCPKVLDLAQKLPRISVFNEPIVGRTFRDLLNVSSVLGQWSKSVLYRCPECPEFQGHCNCPKILDLAQKLPG